MLKEGITFRVIVDEPDDGRWNMAVDEALLETVGSRKSPPVVRLYGFEPPTLSVGRFQPTTEVVNFSLMGAELHTDELTYAFILGKDHLEPFGKRWVYRFIAPLLMAGLDRIGVPNSQSSPVRKGDPLNPDCFGSTGEYEIDSRSGRKLVGSAQMVTRTAVLQHGSIPLSSKGRDIVRYLAVPNAAENHASNLRDELGHYEEFPAVRQAFAQAFRDSLSIRIDRLTPEETARASELLENKYSTDEWNRKY